jgi:phosphoserine phosphatase
MDIMDEIKLVCFDVDDTLVEGSSWLILTKGLGCSPKDILYIFNQGREGKFSFAEGERMLTKMYQDTGNATKPFIKDLFESINVKPEARDLISYLKEKGFLIYLISGAIDIYVESIARKVGADGFYANSSLEFDNRENLQKINYSENQAEVKLKQLQDLLNKLGIDMNMNQVVFVGDSENDVEVFKATKHGIAIRSSNEKLRKVSWRIVNSLSEIKNIL